MRALTPLLNASILSLAIAAAPSLAAGEWPGWRGPDRDGISKETGLLKSWPKEGPRLLWKAKGLGEGYSTPSIASGLIFLMGKRGGDEFVIALHVKDGKEAWAAKIGPVRHDGGGYGGPRSTPTVDGDRLFALGISGDLLCLETYSGKERWRKSLAKDFHGHVPGWGYSESPLVDGPRVLCTPGGKETTIVALDKTSGELLWKSAVPRGERDSPTGEKQGEWDGAQYSSIIKLELDGVPMYAQLLQTGVAGISAADGKFLWRYNRSANGTANIATAIYHDGFLFTATGYGTGGGLVKLSKAADGVKAEEVYFTSKMKNHHGGMILHGDQLYGFDEGILRCLDFKTGEVKWENRSVGKGSLLYADGHFYARSEDGPVALFEANPERYVETGRFDQPDRSKRNSWPHPVISDGRLYLRDQDLLLCYDVKN